MPKRTVFIDKTDPLKELTPARSGDNKFFALIFYDKNKNQSFVIELEKSAAIEFLAECEVRIKKLDDE
jgi:membrane-anchored protein YejM (alkaline phosphatase superfamily)